MSKRGNGEDKLLIRLIYYEPTLLIYYQYSLLTPSDTPSWSTSSCSPTDVPSIFDYFMPPTGNRSHHSESRLPLQTHVTQKKERRRGGGRRRRWRRTGQWPSSSRSLHGEIQRGLGQTVGDDARSIYILRPSQGETVFPRNTPFLYYYHTLPLLLLVEHPTTNIPFACQIDLYPTTVSRWGGWS